MSEHEDKLRKEILEDADRKVKRTLKRAERDAKKLVDQTRENHAKRRKTRLREAEQTAGEKERAILASIEQEKKTRWLQRQERMMDEVFENALQQLRNLDDEKRRNIVANLFAEAQKAVGTAGATVQLKSEDQKLFDNAGDLVDAAAGDGDTAPARKIDLQVNDDIGGGVIVASDDKRRIYDNTYRARLRRLRHRLRAASARILAGQDRTPAAGDAQTGQEAS